MGSRSRRSGRSSWYPAGLVAEGGDVAPPEVPASVEEDALVVETITRLADAIPAVARLSDAGATFTVAGGWVFAAGTGSLSEPDSTLHRRDRIEYRRRDAYLSVDTGKYSIAPWLARRVAGEMTGG
jgi:hypothetical protein